MQTIVLAGNIRETYAWARAQERGLRSVRHVPNAASLQGRNFDRIVELPSFKSRRDRHAVMAAVKRVQRAVRGIPYELDEDWVMPERVDPVGRTVIGRETYLLGDVGDPIHDLTLDELKEAQSDAEQWFDESEGVSPDRTIQDAKPESPAAETSNEQMVPEVSDTVQHVQEILDGARDGDSLEKIQSDEAEKEAKYDAIAATSQLGSDDPVSKPKRRGPRTKERRAYDEAFQAYGENPTPDNSEALKRAREALRQRHPDDERLEGDAPDLDF